MAKPEKYIVLIPHISKKLPRINPLGYEFVELSPDCELYGCKIATEPFRKELQNEDPYIWSSQFIYSFCNAHHALTNEHLDMINPKEDEKNESKDDKQWDVYFCFISEQDTTGLLQIDTVIKADQVHEWLPKKKMLSRNFLSG